MTTRTRALATWCALIVACSVAAAQEPLRFEVASVRANTGGNLGIGFTPPPPDGAVFTNYPLESLVRSAYDLQPFRIIGLPAWTLEARYDINAKAARPITADERRLMLRTLLTERFNLKARFETREQSVYVMTRLRPGDTFGPGLKPRPECVAAAKPCPSGGTGNRGGGFVKIGAITLDRLAAGMMSLMLDQVVRDETGAAGVFDVDLSWRPDTAAADDARPAFFTAVEEQLGLKLTPLRRPVEVLVIESIERATEQ
jgi:uncharacterized protein (TIGR03435 family)